MWLVARKSVDLPRSFDWSSGSVNNFGVRFGRDLQSEKNWSEVQARVSTDLAQKEVVLEGKC